MPSVRPNAYASIQENPLYVQVLRALHRLSDAREGGLAAPAHLTAERELRILINKLLADTSCYCTATRDARECDCSRFETWYTNRLALQELGVFPDGVRPATTTRSTNISNTEPLIEDLLRLTTEGARGRNFLVASTAFEVFVQYVQFLEPERDSYLTCEVATDEALFAPGSEVRLILMGFTPPAASSPDMGTGTDLIVETTEDASPCYHMKVHLGPDPRAALKELARLTSEIFQAVFGHHPDDKLELELHIEAGVKA